MLTALGWLVVVGLWGCGGGEVETAGEPAGGPWGSSGSALTSEQLEKGLGPIRQVTLGELEEELAERGEAVFSLKCAACHKLDQRYVGPPLGGVLERRKPEFVMNMMLNPAEMVEKHPAVREMLAQFMTPMPNQGLTESEARAVLEYLRSAGEQGMKAETSER
jgi:mono/diheme cytochrome c family protein